MITEKTLTWDDLVVLEPRLLILEAVIAEIEDDTEVFCANLYWYGDANTPIEWTLKNRVSNLVGWDSRNPALKTSEAYDVAYQHLYNLLPDCRNCGCL